VLQLKAKREILSITPVSTNSASLSTNCWLPLLALPADDGRGLARRDEAGGLYCPGPGDPRPSATRLSFLQTEGADSFYSTTGQFEKLAAAVKSTTAPKAPRFGPTGYEKGGESPGPGAYRLSLSSFQKSPNKPLAARAAPPASPGAVERLKFQAPDGADSF